MFFVTCRLVLGDGNAVWACMHTITKGFSEQLNLVSLLVVEKLDIRDGVKDLQLCNISKAVVNRMTNKDLRLYNTEQRNAREIKPVKLGT